MVGEPCSIDGCMKTTMFQSMVCYKHRDENPISNIETESYENNQKIKFEIDGKERFVYSKELELMYESLRKARKFWIVDIGMDDDEFVQYAIEKGELEHWDNKEMVESLEMSEDEAFETLDSKIRGDYSGHTLWWGDSQKESEKNEQNKGWLIFPVLTILLYIIHTKDRPLHLFDGFRQIGFFGADACLQGICFLAFAGGAGAASLGRTETGKFTDE